MYLVSKTSDYYLKRNKKFSKKISHCPHPLTLRSYDSTQLNWPLVRRSKLNLNIDEYLIREAGRPVVVQPVSLCLASFVSELSQSVYDRSAIMKSYGTRVTFARTGSGTDSLHNWNSYINRNPSILPSARRSFVRATERVSWSKWIQPARVHLIGY